MYFTTHLTVPLPQEEEEDADAATQREEQGDSVGAMGGASAANTMSDQDVLEKLIVVTPSRSRGQRGGASAGAGDGVAGAGKAIDSSTSRLIADGLALYEQELAEVRAGKTGGGSGWARSVELGGMRRAGVWADAVWRLGKIWRRAGGAVREASVPAH